MNINNAMRTEFVLFVLLSMPTLASAQSVAPAGLRLISAAEAAPGAKMIDNPASRVVGQATPLTDDDLAGNRGGQTVVASGQTLTAVTTGNTLNGNYSAGSIVLSGSALSNFNGIGNFAINTGAQVSIQSGMNLTINVAP